MLLNLQRAEDIEAQTKMNISHWFIFGDVNIETNSISISSKMSNLDSKCIFNYHI